MSDIPEDEKFLKAFSQHGVEFIRMVDDENAVANCPFSGGKEKFFVNKNTGQWDSKNTGRQGNLYTFLEDLYKFWLAKTNAEHLRDLSIRKKTPIDIYYGTIAYNQTTNQYMLPCYGANGKLTDVAMYANKKNSTIRRTAKSHLAINGLMSLKSSTRGSKVLVFEGEWDWYIGKWLHATMKDESACLCLPGAGVFKDEWLENFRDRDVYLCYDNDAAGRQGEAKTKKIRTIAKSVQFLYWPESTPENYDFRDFIIEQLAGNPQKATRMEVIRCYKTFYNMFGFDTFDERNRPAEEEDPKVKVEIPHYTELENIFKKWMELNTLDPIAVVYGTYFANKLDGDPIWTFLVGPPSSNKTEFLLSLSTSPFIETTSTLTPTSLISGLRFSEGQPDPSLIPRLDGRVLVIKDFTTILNHNQMVREDLFGILRDAYDGEAAKIFGTGVKKSFKSKFGIIAGVTPAIDGFMNMNASLGERFIKYRLDENITEAVEESRMLKAFDNINKEKSIRAEIQSVGIRMAEKRLPPPEKIPTWDEKVRDIIIGCARFTAIMRGVNNKDRYTKEQITKPVREIAIRLSKQYMKLCQGIAIFYDHDTIGEIETKIVKKVARDTCPDRTEYIVRQMYLLGGNVQVNAEWLVEKTKLSSTTISAVVNDLMPLGILRRVGGKERWECTYVIGDDLRACIERAGIYEEYKTNPPADIPPRKFRVKKFYD